MARTPTPRMYRICELVRERPRSFAEIEAAFEGMERLGLGQLIVRMSATGILRRIKRLSDPAGGRKGRFLYARGEAPLPPQRLRPARIPRALATNTERGAPRVSMEAFGLLCKAFRIAPSTTTPAASTVRTVRGIDTMRPGPDIARQVLPIGRFTLPVDEFGVAR